MFESVSLRCGGRGTRNLHYLKAHVNQFSRLPSNQRFIIQSLLSPDYVHQLSFSRSISVLWGLALVTS